jgi:GxxExxY protein
MYDKMNKILKIEEATVDYDLAGKVIGFAMKVHSKLGSGFLESVYQNALALELRRAGLKIESEKPILVRYEQEVVGAFVADLFVNDALIVETKAIQVLAKIHEVQLVNYLVATGIDEGLLLNFGAEQLEFKKKFRRRKQEDVSSDQFC